MPNITNIQGWDGTQWVKLLCNAAGKLIIDPSEILQDDPQDSEVGKAPTANWAHDEAAARAAADAIIGGGHITILPLSWSAIGQGTFAIIADASAYTGWIAYNSSVANGDNISYQVYLAAGTYALLLLTVTATNRAIVDFDIDATEVASFDCYSGAAVYNALKTQTGIVIATSGLKTLKARIHGRNGSSTGWFLNIIYIALWRTA